jgi:thiamine kinase-like enzyme
MATPFYSCTVCSGATDISNRGLGGGKLSDVMADRGMLEVQLLPFWTGPIRIWPLTGGITNRNYGVEQADGQRFAVRLGQDIPAHGVMRFNEQAAAEAAAKAGVSPKIYFTAPGVMVSRLLPGRNLTPDEIRLPENRGRVVALLKTCHGGMAEHLRGPLLAFWVFHINRSYLNELAESGSRIAEHLPELGRLNTWLEREIGAVDVVFGHNDLLAGNIFDDGARLWLLDWDYAGFNTPLFDLANLSSNNGFSREDDLALLKDYYGAPDAGLMRTLEAMKCASLLREALWSAVSERQSAIDFDYPAYTDDYLARLAKAVDDLH